VFRFAGAGDPIEAVTLRAREVVLDAIQAGWTGPPFDPVALARWLGMDVKPRDDLADARVVAEEGSRLRIEFNPTRPRGRLRYSIAHEIAHTFFPDVADKTRHRTGTGALEELAVTDEWQLELLCNLAAGEFLVPSLALPGAELDEAAGDINRLMGLRARFDVSTEAMLRRVAQAATLAITVFAAARIGSAEQMIFRIDYAVASRSWDARLKRGRLVESKVMGECTAVGFTAVGTESWGGSEDVSVQAVGIPPYPGEQLPRVAGLLIRGATSNAVPAIRYLAGDATQPRGEGPRIIAHLVNDRARAWGGRGFAMALKRAQPHAAQAYRAWTIASPDNLRLGNVHIVDLSEGITVASMVAQEGFGDTSVPRLSYTALAECLSQLRVAAERRKAEVHLPRIGTGQAGGVWDLVADLVEVELCRSGIEVTVYSRPGEHSERSARGRQE
jgi:Zn-dependent peptidase ImmA (M78 family)